MKKTHKITLPIGGCLVIALLLGIGVALFVAPVILVLRYLGA